MAGRFGGNSGNIQWDGKSEELNPLVSFGLVSYDYVETMGITMKEGRGFSREYPGDTTDWYSTRTGNFVINEKLEKLMGVESAIGMQMSFLGVSGSVVGVTKDFHFTSLMNDIPPLAMLLTPVEPTFAIIRLAPNKIESTIDNIDEKWAQIFPNQPFDFSFTDENIDRMYRSFDRMSSILRYFAGFAIIIACLGLFGLVSFISEQRTKELGIRKTLGASTAGLTILLCKEFFWLVLISNIIAFPAAYYYTNDWLSGFAYRITISPMLFITAGFAALLLALGTVTFKAFKAARNNPVDSLRYE
jgi:ABC-type antimicrobial peptide transport system permease subunit